MLKSFNFIEPLIVEVGDRAFFCNLKDWECYLKQFGNSILCVVPKSKTQSVPPPPL